MFFIKIMDYQEAHKSDEEDSVEDGEAFDDESESEQGDDGMSADEIIALRQKISTLPLAKLTQLKTKLGPALFNKVLYGSKQSAAAKPSSIGASSSSKNYNAEVPKRAGPKHPREESSKKPPPKLRKIHGLQLKKPKNAHFDPRFSADCGDFDEVAFHRDYAFLDDYRQKDIKQLQKALRQAKREQKTDQARRIKQNILRLKNQQKASSDQRLMEEIRAELRQSNIDRMNSDELHQRFLERKRHIHGEAEEKGTEETLNEKRE